MTNIFYRSNEFKSLSNDKINQVIEENVQNREALKNVKNYFKKHRDIRSFRQTYHLDGYWCFDSTGLCFAECSTSPSPFSFKGTYHKKDMYKIINTKLKLSNKLVEESRILREQKLVNFEHMDLIMNIVLTYNNTYTKAEAKRLFRGFVSRSNLALITKLISYRPCAIIIRGFYEYGGYLYVGFMDYEYLRIEQKDLIGLITGK